MPSSKTSVSIVFVSLTMVLLGAQFWDIPGFLISSDTLSPAEFAWDALHRPQAWSDFQQSRVPSTIPDIAIFGLVQIVTGSWRIAMLVWVSAIIGGLVTVGGWIVARIARCSFAIALLCLSPLLCLVLAGGMQGFPWLFSGTNSAGYFFPYLFILLPNTHGGPFVLALGGAVLAAYAAERPKAARIIGLALLSCATCLSDLLGVTSLLAPLSAALLGAGLTAQLSRRIIFRLLWAAWGGCIIGIAGAQLLPKSPTPYPPLAAIPGNIHLFLSDLLRHPSLIGVIALFILFIAADVSRRGMRSWLGNFWSVFAATSGLSSLLITAVDYQEIWSYRYAMPLLWWTVIKIAASLAGIATRHPSLARIPTGVVAAVLLTAYLSQGWHVPRLLLWQTPVADCLLKAKLRSGLAEYWSARVNGAASDWRVQIVQVTSAGGAHIWVNDPDWFAHDIHDQGRRPDFSFIIMDGLPQDKIAAAYGPADHAMTCGASTVWVYNDSRLMYQNLVRASPYAAELFAGAPRQ